MTNSCFDVVFVYRKGSESGIGRLNVEGTGIRLLHHTLRTELDKLGVEDYTLLKCERM